MSIESAGPEDIDDRPRRTEIAQDEPSRKLDPDERLRTWILFAAGIVVLMKFSFASPNDIPPALTLVVVGCLFGKGILNVWKGGSKP